MIKRIVKTAMILMLLHFPMAISSKTLSEIMIDVLNAYDQPDMSIVYVDAPNAEENYYTFKIGSDGSDMFLTSSWIHVYTEPVYRIYEWNIASGEEELLHEGSELNEEIIADAAVDMVYTFPCMDSGDKKYYIPK